MMRLVAFLALALCLLSSCWEEDDYLRGTKWSYINPGRYHKPMTIEFARRNQCIQTVPAERRSRKMVYFHIGDSLIILLPDSSTSHRLANYIRYHDDDKMIIVGEGKVVEMTRVREQDNE